MARCVCPGSFDPVTRGHLDIVLRSAELFDEVVVAVARNPGKPPRFDLDRRVSMLTRALADEGPAEAVARIRVEVLSDGLLVDLCRRVGANAVVKGVRSERDLGYEWPMARMNRELTGVDTVFLVSDPRWQHVSSSLVSEVAGLGGDVSALVPEVVRAGLGRPDTVG